MKTYMKNIINWLTGVALLATLNLHAQERKLSLEDALAVARENNKGLKVKMLETKLAKEETNISKASMLPTISATGGYSYYFDRQVIFMPGAFTGNEAEPVVDVAVGGKNVFNSYITISQPIVSEAARKQIKASRINESVHGLNVKDQMANVAVEVTATYYRALLIQQSIELNKQSLTRNLRSLEDSRMLLIQGKSLKIDTLRNFIVVENLKTTISYLENQGRVTLLQLQQQLGTSQDEALILTDSLKHDTEARYFAAVESIYTDAIQSRPDIQIKKLDIEMSKNQLSLSRAQRLPTLSAVGMYQLQAQSDDRRFETHRWPVTSFIGLQANVPIFGGNGINSRVRQAKLHLETSTLRLEDATEKANTEILTLQNNLKEVFQRLSIQERTVQAAEINFKIVNDRYKNGLSSRLELSDAELALTEAKMNQLNLIFSVKMSKLQLDKALGIL
jgi:outer membrane protein